MAKEKITVEQAIETFKDIELGQEFTRAEIKYMIETKYGYKDFLPSDYCYNRVNKGINLEKNLREKRCLFEYMGFNKYKYMGTGKFYTGNIFHKPKGEAESVVGKIEKNVITWLKLI